MSGVFDLDKWQEVLHTLRHNKLRTLLTALGVMWGIFMLVLMLGFGNGLERGVMRNMIGFVSNSVYVWGQRTQKPYLGMAPGRHIRFTTQDIEALRTLDGVEALAPRNQLGGWRDGNNVTYASKTGNFGVMGDYPALLHVDNIEMTAGRFLNALDIRDTRKVTVIGQHVQEVLFDKGDNPIGAYIKIRGVFFRVVGVQRSGLPGQEGDRRNSTLYVPFTTFRVAFNAGDSVGWFAVLARDNINGADLEHRVKRVLGSGHRVHPDDLQAIGSYNAAEKFGRMHSLFGGIRFFIWFVSVATLLAGALGVSNIMLISVKERTREIGVRKALGATPFSIVAMVLQESTLLTALAGYSGLVVGVVTLEGVSSFLQGSKGPLAEPSIDLGVALIAAVILAVCGLVAGLAPARHAARIRPVAALRAE